VKNTEINLAESSSSGVAAGTQDLIGRVQTRKCTKPEVVYISAGQQTGYWVIAFFWHLFSCEICCIFDK
jgi:hypothetical protein